MSVATGESRMLGIQYNIQYKVRNIGSHFEIQNGGQTKIATIDTVVQIKSLVTRICAFPSSLLLYIAYE